MTAHKGQTETPIADQMEQEANECGWLRNEIWLACIRQLERKVAHADAAGYARGLEDALTEVTDFLRQRGMAHLPDDIRDYVRSLLKPAQDKGAAHE